MKFWAIVSLLVAPAAGFSSLFALDQDNDGAVYLDILGMDGSAKRLATLPFLSAINKFQGSVTADAASSVVYATNQTTVVAINSATGDIQQQVAWSGGSLRHIAYDYKHAVDGAPGYSLYGLWETNDFQVQLVQIDKTTLLPTPLVSLNVTGHVILAGMGLPKVEPQWGEPEMKHYGMIVVPAGANPASAPILAWMKVAGVDLGWGYLSPANLMPVALAIDFDGGNEKPTLAHNVFILMANETGGSDFGIVHMSGALQSIKSHSSMVASDILPTQAATVDMPNAKFYATQVGSGAVYLNGFDCITGKMETSVVLSSVPKALYLAQQ